MSSDIKHILRQANSEVRNENIAKIFRKNRKVLLVILTVAISSSLAFTAYKINKKSQQEKYSEILHQSMIDQQLGDVEKAKQNLKKIYDSTSAPSGVKSLASLRYAVILLEEGKKNEAINVYSQVNQCRFCDNYIKELAGLLMVRTLMNDEDISDKADLSEKILAIENNSKILRYYIAEQRGYLEMTKNNLEKSYQIFEMIAKNPEVREDLKNRASDAMKIVIQKGYEPKKS
jgi:hypothetical protein